MSSKLFTAIARKRNFFALVLANLFSNSATLAVGLLLPSIVGPTGFAIYSIAANLVNNALSVIDFGVSNSFVKWWNDPDAPFQTRTLLSALILVRMAGSVLLIAVAYPLAVFLSHHVYAEGNIPASVIFLSLLVALPGGWWSTVRVVNQARQEFQKQAMNVALYGGLRLIAVGSLWLLGSSQPMAYVIALYGAPALVLVAVDLARTAGSRIVGKPMSPNLSIDRHAIRASCFLVNYGKWHLLSLILYPMVSVGPMMIMGQQGQLHEAGFIALALFFATLPTPVSSALGLMLLPKVTSLESRTAVTAYTLRILKLWHISVGISVLYAALCIGLRRVAYPSEFAQADVAIALVVPAYIFAIYTGLVFPVLHRLSQPRIPVFINIGRVLLSCSLSWWLLPHYGYVAVAAAIGFSVVIGEIVQCVYVCRRLDIAAM